jgi:hypothetical protein
MNLQKRKRRWTRDTCAWWAMEKSIFRYICNIIFSDAEQQLPRNRWQVYRFIVTICCVKWCSNATDQRILVLPEWSAVSRTVYIYQLYNVSLLQNMDLFGARSVSNGQLNRVTVKKINLATKLARNEGFDILN